MNYGSFPARRWPQPAAIYGIVMNPHWAIDIKSRIGIGHAG
jgi:hypothetical protein